MKKILVLLMALFMTLSLVACGEKAEPASGGSNVTLASKEANFTIQNGQTVKIAVYLPIQK